VSLGKAAASSAWSPTSAIQIEGDAARRGDCWACWTNSIRMFNVVSLMPVLSNRGLA